jgi:GT2 family glycosyltransferase
MQAEGDPRPLVTLGVPVYNGGALIERALGSLQAQTYPHLEILVSDNASTDDTQTICRRIAAGDPRIRYVRQPENLGSARNFEFLAREARGGLFAWCAHDDLRLPGFVAACVEELERRPEAVLCTSALTFLDEEGRTLAGWRDNNFETRGLSRAERARRFVDHVFWFEIYGLIRREALLKALPFESMWGSDVVLSMKLLMLGDFAKVPDRLSQYRVRSVGKSAEKTHEEVMGRKVVVRQPWTGMAKALLRVPMDAAADSSERADVLVAFLAALIGVEARGRSPSWGEMLAHEHRGELSRAPSRRALARFILPRLTDAAALPEREIVERALRSARRESLRSVLRRAGLNSSDEIQRLLVAAGRRFPRLYAAYRRIFPLAPAARGRG